MNPTGTLPPVRASAAVAAPVDRRSILRKAFDCARVMSGFAVYGLLSLLSIPPCLVVALCVRDRRRRRGLCQGIIHRCVSLYARYTEWSGIFRVNLPEIERLRSMRGTVLAPNHASLMDATHFLARLPRLVCVMKKSIVSNPVMGITTSLAGYLPLEHGTEFIRRGRDALTEGSNLLVFPEGTRTVEPPVNSFKTGYALMASLAGAPVQAVFIEMPVLFMNKNWPLWKTPPLPLPINILLGEQFRVRPGQSARAFSAELETYFRRELGPTATRGVRRNRSVSC